jgi:phosphoribosylformimino-5-aminoimidazole carboxamide ribotide isomerase
MELYPSIDLREGRVVRLLQGDFDRETHYSDDPVAVARTFADAGTPWIHVVDPHAARGGEARNLQHLEAICAAVDVKVQASGGVRTVADASARFAAGATRVVVGSAAVEHPEVVDELASLHPGHVAVGLDARGRDVAIHGWETSTGLDLFDLVARFDDPRIGALVFTEIGRDGTLHGPAFDLLTSVMEATSVPVIASGGVSELDDIRALAGLRSGDRRLAGVITGKAIYEGRFSVAEGVAACSASV